VAEDYLFSAGYQQLGGRLDMRRVDTRSTQGPWADVPPSGTGAQTGVHGGQSLLMRLAIILVIVAGALLAWRASRDLLTAVFVVSAVLVAGWIKDADATIDAPAPEQPSTPACLVPAPCTLSV
jgi:hypothetical protein